MLVTISYMIICSMYLLVFFFLFYCNTSSYAKSHHHLTSRADNRVPSRRTRCSESWFVSIHSLRIPSQSHIHWPSCQRSLTKHKWFLSLQNKTWKRMTKAIPSHQVSLQNKMEVPFPTLQVRVELGMMPFLSIMHHEFWIVFLTPCFRTFKFPIK